LYKSTVGVRSVGSSNQIPFLLCFKSLYTLIPIKIASCLGFLSWVRSYRQTAGPLSIQSVLRRSKIKKL